MPAKAKRATGAGDMQDGDDIEAITAVSSWMYEFCSRNNMVDAMYGIMNSYERQFNCRPDVLMESGDNIVLIKRCIDKSDFENALESLELIQQNNPDLDTSPTGKLAEVIKLIKVHSCFKNVADLELFKQSVDAHFPPKDRNYAAVRKDIMILSTGKATEAQTQLLRKAYPLSNLISAFNSFAIEARRIMPTTKLDQVLRAVRNGNFEFEKPEGKKGSSSSTTTRSGASPKKAAAPQVQPKEESANSSALSSQAKAEDAGAKKRARPSAVDDSFQAAAKAAAKEDDVLVVQAVAVTSGKRKEAPAPVQRGGKAAEAQSAPKKQYVGVSAWDLRDSLERFGDDSTVDWNKIHRCTHPDVIAWHKRAGDRSVAHQLAHQPGDSDESEEEEDEEYDDADNGNNEMEEEEEEEEEESPVRVRAKSGSASSGKENVAITSGKAGDVTRDLASARANMTSDDPLKSVLKAAAKAAPGTGKVALETTGGKSAEWETDSDGDEDEDGSRRDIHLPAIGQSSYQPRSTLTGGRGGGKSGKGSKGSSSSSKGVKKHVAWTEEEEEQLVKGVSAYGVGAWNEILEHFSFNSCRNNVHLKDKWRNLKNAGKVTEGPAGSAAARV